MRPENAIEVRDATKRFKVFIDKGNTVKERVLFSNRRKYEYRQVLKGISFDVKKGEAVGLIGHNGCGKSTTLKLLTKILYPNSGSIEISGRVSSLIELGAGFHPDLSGKENIYINASIFGLSKKEIDSRLEDIIAFSELEEFIDNPVRTYSSGMYMRLAFSVAINVDADVLLIDEILAVGDVAFQAKCFNRLKEIKAKGTTIVIVSHSLSQIEQICDRSIWIHEGLIREDGLPRIVDPHYMEYMSEKVVGKVPPKKQEQEQAEAAPADKTPEKAAMEENASEAKEKNEDKKRWGTGEVRIKKITLSDSEGTERNQFFNTEEIAIRIEYKAQRAISDAVIGIAVYRDDQTHIYGTNTLIDYSEPVKLCEEGTVLLKFRSLPFNAGKYTLDFAFHRPDGFNYDFWREAESVIIKNKLNEAGIVSIPHEWEIR